MEPAKTDAPLVGHTLQNVVQPFELSFLLETTRHESFAEAFKELYRRMTEQPLNAHLRESVWIIRDGDRLPTMFYEAVDRAYEEGLMHDGKPTWLNAGLHRTSEAQNNQKGQTS
jgi:flagellin-specific chaperone FliS